MGWGVRSVACVPYGVRCGGLGVGVCRAWGWGVSLLLELLKRMALISGDSAKSSEVQKHLAFVESEIITNAYNKYWFQQT